MKDLEIFVYGPLEDGFLDIAPNAILDMESLEEMFDEDISIGEFSLPVDIPWTDKNRRILGFAERLENFGSGQQWFRCDVYDNGFPEIVNGKITILEKNGQFSYLKGSFSASISGTKGIYGSLIKNKKLADLKLGGSIAWTTYSSREFAKNHAMGLYPQFSQISFAPVAIEGFIDTDRADYDNEFLALDTVNNVIVTGGGIDDWTFGRPSSSDPTVAVSAGNAEYIDYRTVPFFKMKFILRQVFEEYGFNIIGDWMHSTDFDDATVFNNYAIENYDTTYHDLTRSITPQNHVPDMLISDWLKAIFSFFNIFPRFVSGNAVLLVRRTDKLKSKKIASFNNVGTNEFSSAYNTEETSDTTSSGYKLNYNWDSNDSMFSDKVKDISDKNLFTTVTKFTDLSSISNSGRTVNDIAFVTADNMYYQVADATVFPMKWDAYSEKLDAYISGEGGREVNVDVSVMCNYTVFNETTGLWERKNYVGCAMKGSYITNRKGLVKNPFGLHLFYIKKVVVLGTNIPMSFCNNRDRANNVIETYSLGWNGDDAMAVNFHTPWQDLLSKAEYVKTTILIDQKVLADIRNNDLFEIGNVLFLLYKTQKNLPLKNMIDVQLVPL